MARARRARCARGVAALAPFALRLGALARVPVARAGRASSLLELEPEAPLAALAGAVERGVVRGGLRARGARLPRRT